LVTRGFDPHLPDQTTEFKMERDSKKKYLVEYNKYKDVQLFLEEVYVKRSRTSEKVILLEIDEEAQMARVKNVRTGVLQTKTLHWCRKNLEPVKPS
jgi:hypothetical protein